jgi:hypothetical protein
MLMNSDFVLDQSLRFAKRLAKDAGDDRARQITRAWQVAFNRAPSASELTEALAFLSRQVEHLSAVGEKKDEKKAKAAAKPAPEVQALANLCQALLSANEFLYVD